MRIDREFWGWILFLGSAVAFLAASIRDGDLLLGIGSVAFLVSCVLFLRVHAQR